MRRGIITEFLERNHLIVSHTGTDYATSLRGVAAVMVFLLHGNFFAPFLSLAKNLGTGTSQVQNLANLGGAGPAAFFVASGFVLSLLWKKSKSAGLFRFACRRYVRLMPLYLVVSLIILYNDYRDGKHEIEIVSYLLARLLFLDTLSYEQFISLPLAVMWTIGVEFWLSLTIPFLVALFNSNRYSNLGLFCILSLSIASPLLLMNLGVDSLMAFKSVPACLASFALGVYASCLTPSFEANRVFRSLFMINLSFLFMYFLSGFMGAWWITSLLSFCFLSVNRTSIEISRQKNSFLWLGTTCYGIYLLHIPLVQLTSRISENYAALLAFIPLLFLSSISWLFLERPIILFFSKKLKKV